MSRNRFQAVKGTRDILPPESALWNRVEQTARRVFATYGFGEIRLPIFEQYELFARAVGDETDIVSKEMYVFEDKYLEEPAGAPSRNWIDALDRALEEGQIPQILHNIFVVSELKEGFKRWEEYIHKPSTEKTEETEREFDKLTLYLGVLGQSYRTLNMITLRPEATASVARAYIEHGMKTRPGLTRLFYLGPMFRRERPQKGRYRQFYQIGAEVMGQSDHPAIDAEVIEMLLEFISQCGLKEWKLAVNAIGCPECRPGYVEKLRGELLKVKDKLGPDSQRRIETNPLRVLDSKVEGEQAVIAGLPSILDSLCEACREHFGVVKEELKARGIEYENNWRLVRGLDYYMRTTFEVTAPGLGSQDAICGGGRYDGLVEMVGGPPTKGMGFALGTDRLILALQAPQNAGQAAGATGDEVRLDAYVTYLGEAARGPARSITQKLRGAGASVVCQAEERKLGKSLDLAAKSGARFAVIIGEEEVKQGNFVLRDLDASEQESVSETEILQKVRPK